MCWLGRSWSGASAPPFRQPAGPRQLGAHPANREVDQLDTPRAALRRGRSDHPGGARSAAVAAVTMVVADEPLLYGGAHEHGDPVPIPEEPRTALDGAPGRAHGRGARRTLRRPTLVTPTPSASGRPYSDGGRGVSVSASRHRHRSAPTRRRPGSAILGPRDRVAVAGSPRWGGVRSSLAGLDSPSARRPRANDHHWEVAMLGHEDERRLAAIEQQLLRDDADFVRRLTRRHLVVTRSTWRRLGAACSGCLCALATVVVLLAGSGHAHPGLPRDDGCGRVHVPSRPASPPPAPLATCLGRGAGGDRRTPS